MSTSELRRGPGWWMDLEGQWNSPESWPESSPPLPGWTRGTDGLWHAPASATGETLMPTPDEFAVLEGMAQRRTQPIPDVRRSRLLELPEIHEPQHVSSSSPQPLSFSETEAVVQPEVDLRRAQSRAIAACAIAAATATMIAAGLIVLLTLF